MQEITTITKNPKSRYIHVCADLARDATLAYAIVVNNVVLLLLKKDAITGYRFELSVTRTRHVTSLDGQDFCYQPIKWGVEPGRVYTNGYKADIYPVRIFTIGASHTPPAMTLNRF